MTTVTIPIDLSPDDECDDRSFATTAVLATLEQIAVGHASVVIEDDSGAIDQQWEMTQPNLKSKVYDLLQQAIYLIEKEQDHA